MANYITIGFNILCIVLILFGIFWGLIRGLKKTISRLIFLLALGIALIFITIPITNALLQIPISTTFIEAEGEIVKQVPIADLLTILLEGFIGKDFATNYPEFTKVLLSLPMTIIYSIMFVILFWTLKILLLPLNAIINRIIFGGKKRNADEFGFSASNEHNDLQFLDKEIKNVSITGKAKKQETKKEKKSKPEKEKPIQKTKQPKQKHKSDKPQKHRFLGGIVGAFVGIIITFFTMVPFYGFITITDSVKNLKINHITSEPTSLDDLSNGLLSDVVKGYELSTLGRISNTLGIEQLGVSTFDHLTTIKLKNDEINLRDNLNTMVSTIIKADNLIGTYKQISENGINNISQDQLDQLISKTEEIIIECSNIKFVNSLSNYILPLLNEVMIQNDIQLVEDNELNFLIMQMLTDLTKESNINVFTELNSIIEIAKYINNQKLLLPIVSGNTTELLTVMNNLDSDFSEQLTSKIFSIKTVDTVLPQMLNIGLKFFDNSVNFGYVENTASKVELKLSISQLFTNLIDTARTLSSESNIYITDSSILELGKVLNTFRNSKLFNIETYNNLVDYTINKVKTLTTTIIPASFTDTFNNKLLRNVSEVENWQAEMTIIYDTIQILRDNNCGILGQKSESEDKRIGYSLDFTLTDATLINLGKALDKLESSTLFGSSYSTNYDGTNYTNTTFTSIFTSTITEIYNTLSSSEDSNMDIISIMNNMKDNIITSNHTYTNNSKFWENEFTIISPLIIEVSNIINGAEFELTNSIGETLDDCAHNSILLGKDTTLILMEKIMSIIQDGILGENYAPIGDECLNDKIYNLLIAIRNNLLSEELYETLQSDESFWTTEIDCILALSNITDKSSTITSIASAKTIAEDLDKIYTSRIIPTTELNITLAKVLRQLKTNETEGINGKINKLIEDIAIDISSSTFFDDKTKTNFWTIELDYIETLTNIKFSDDGSYKVVDNLSSIGTNIDDIVYGSETHRASYLITENRIRDILAFAIEDLSTSISNNFENGELKTTITSTLHEISTNIYDSTLTTQKPITSFERELGNLTKLAKLDISSELFTYTNDPEYLQTLENKIMDLGASLDSIAHNTCSDSNITSYDESKNSNIITRSMIANIICAGFSSAIISDRPPEELNNSETAYNNIIEDIKENINNIALENKVIKWERELTYIRTLVQINSGETFYFNQIGEKIGSIVDIIAFNHKDNTFLDVVYNSDKNIVGKYITKEIDNSDPDNINTIYYNSVIIDRDIIRTAMNTMYDDFSSDNPSYEEEITNDLLNNLKIKISVENYNSTLYNDYQTAFAELNDLVDTIDNLKYEFNQLSIETITNEEILAIDSILDSFDAKIICGPAITQKIAILLINKLSKDNTETSEEELTNEIIENVCSKIENNHVSDYATTFTQMKEIYNSLENVRELFINKEITVFTREELIEIDKMLKDFQETSICGVITTRKVAKLMVEKAKESLIGDETNPIITGSSVATYMNELIDYYNSGITNANNTPETYYSETTSTYANPMATIYDKIQEIISQV